MANEAVGTVSLGLGTGVGLISIPFFKGAKKRRKERDKLVQLYATR